MHPWRCLHQARSTAHWVHAEAGTAPAWEQCGGYTLSQQEAVQRCAAIFSQGDTRRALRSGVYGIIGVRDKHRHRSERPALYGNGWGVQRSSPCQEHRLRHPPGSNTVWWADATSCDPSGVKNPASTKGPDPGGVKAYRLTGPCARRPRRVSQPALGCCPGRQCLRNDLIGEAMRKYASSRLREEQVGPVPPKRDRMGLYCERV